MVLKANTVIQEPPVCFMPTYKVVNDFKNKKKRDKKDNNIGLLKYYGNSR